MNLTFTLIAILSSDLMQCHALAEVRMAERSKALRSGRSPVFRAWVRIPLLTSCFKTELPIKIDGTVSLIPPLHLTRLARLAWTMVIRIGAIVAQDRSAILYDTTSYCTQVQKKGLSSHISEILPNALNLKKALELGISILASVEGASRLPDAMK